MKAFLKRKHIEFTLKRYGVEAMGAMAMGLFASLIVGLILDVTGQHLQVELLRQLGGRSMAMAGPAIGVAVAYGLKAPPLVLFASTITGMAGYEMGGPAGSFVAVVIGAELGKVVSGETKLDILVSPITTISAGVTAGMVIGPGVGRLMAWVGMVIMAATELHPVPMGIMVAVIVGMALTLPISSAALCIMLGLSGIAAGAATVGCCCQMMGFAVTSYKDNGWSGLLSQGLGTSMLQIPNIVKNPYVWIPPTLSGAVLGPVATTVLKMENIPTGAGMGTSGLVGQFGTVHAMGLSGTVLLKIGLLHFLLPVLLSLFIMKVLSAKGLVRPGDLTLPGTIGR